MPQLELPESDLHGEQSGESAVAPTAPKSTNSRAKVVNSLARRLDPNFDVHKGGFSTGEAAELRRLDAAAGVDSTCAPFWRIVIQDLEPNGLIREREDGTEDLSSWIAIVKSLAQMAGLHRPGRPFGAALAAAGVSEMRLTRLLRARGDELYDQLRVTLHALSSQGEGVDGLDLAHFVLSDVGPEEDFRERVRRRVARFYYRAESQSSKTGSPTSQITDS